MKQRLKKFFNWIWQECKDKKTLAIFACVIVIMYSPVWGGYLLHFLFGWAWCSALASAYLLFWAGPFTPFFPICLAITLAIKRIIKRLNNKKTPKDTSASEEEKADGPPAA